MSWVRFLPIIILAGVAAALAVLLLRPAGNNQTDRMVGEPLPEITLEALEGYPGFEADSLRGQSYLINVWGSWCPPCEVEHPVLMEMAEAGVPIYGIAWRDSPAAASEFLAEHGNPFAGVVLDPYGEAVIALGVTGAPETFVVDGEGVIRARWAGVLTRRVVTEDILPALEAGN